MNKNKPESTITKIGLVFAICVFYVLGVESLINFGKGLGAGLFDGYYYADTN